MTDLSRRGAILSAAALAGLAIHSPALAQAAAQAQAEPGAAWDLADLYPNDAAWEAERQKILADIPRLAARKGTLGAGAASLRDTLQAASDLDRRASRLYIYASLKADEDLRVAANQERRQQARDLYTAYGEATSWMNPEILAVGAPKIRGFVAADPGLGKFRFQLEDVLRQAPHTLTTEGEALLASTSSALSGPKDVRDQLASADIPRPEVTLSTGETVRLDDQGYTRWRAADNRADRKLVFDAFWASYKKFEGSLGAAMAAKIKGDIFESKARKYGSSLEAALSGPNIPVSVYKTLVEETNRGLPQLHRYFDLRRRMLKLPDMAYYDIYPPLVSLDRKFSLAEMRSISLEALKPLGPVYGGLLADATAKRWMDPFPRRGKSSGAYMNGGAYDVHPYLLLNLDDTYSSVSTYAHEWGHAVHTLLAKQAQPYETAGYATFTAEVASTGNEQLLIRQMLKTAKTREEKLFYLGQQMENFRGTFFRQAMFAEFELSSHEMAERGDGVSGARLTELYLTLLKKYHGPGVTIDPAYAIEWAFIPHFYRNFYVFQYATSIAGAVQLTSNVLTGGAKAREAFLDALRAGGSDYPVEILKRAGVDLTTPTPYRALVAEFGRTLDQAEALLKT